MENSSRSPFVSLGNLLHRHPLLRAAILYAIPALVFGAILRLLVLHYSPLAYWGADSRSFMGFSNGVLTELYFSINEKRRYLYPIFLLPISILPGGTLAWLGWIQALLGLATILPMAYLVRRTFVAWRWLIIPVTVVYASLPVFIWYEHELIAETITFNCIVWILGGWAAWVCQKDPARARALWWWFFVPLAILFLTKPSGKFLWPGIVIALVVVLSWRTLRWPQWVAIVGLFFASLTVGDDDQSSWLLYTTAFPLTQLDTPLHAEIKAELRPLVERKMANLALYEEEDDEVHDILRSPEDHPEYPRLQALAKSDKALDKLYRDLAREAILEKPHLFVLIAIQRLVGSANPADFKTERFANDYFSRRFETQYNNGKNQESMLRIAFGVPKGAPFPSYEALKARIQPYPESKASDFMIRFSDAYHSAGELVHRPKGSRSILTECRPTILACWLAIGVLASLFLPYLRTMGVWSIAFGGYLFAVYLVGVEHHRYFAFAWPLFIVLIALPVDAAVRLFKRDNS